METGLQAAAELLPALCEASGAIIRSYFRQRVDVEDKPDASPVTIADRETEAKLRQLIGQRFPHHGIVGEEYGTDRADAEWVWVLDPIDGTKSFISGVPLFGTLIALLHQGQPVLGTIDQPIARERWIGIKGLPSLFNGKVIATRACDAPAKATIFTTSPDMFEGAEAEAWRRASQAAKLVRYGADCYAYGLLASGFVDAVIESSLKPYDYCALIPVIQGAGGLITDWTGRSAGLDGDGRILAAGDPKLHEALVRVLAG
ncbi:MAG TPA: histidinol-phosphatase [Stellaceae bacterium]|jgi:histidinol phosphatase-like enzyme (inositol monophosphatase family)|nr:histidinol-phosphatase [Stellaceae bacterium]